MNNSACPFPVVPALIHVALAAMALLLTQPAPAAPPVCAGANLRLTTDDQYFIGSAQYQSASGEAESGSFYQWLTNTAPLASGLLADNLLLHFDGTPNGVNGQTPMLAQNLAYSAGKWGSCLALPANGRLEFSPTNNLSLSQGTLEMWVALTADATNSVYTNRDHTLFQYRASNGDYMQIDQSPSQILYAGGTVSNQWESAYGSLGSVAGWHAGEWHHLAFTWSAPQSVMSFYVDGALAAANNEGHYWPPSSGGAVFSVGSDVWGNNVAAYDIDELRISSRVADATEIAARARRLDAPQPNEVWLPATNVPLGSLLVYAYTPASLTQTGEVCTTEALIWTGIPITNAQPSSTLLPVGATSVNLAVQTVVAAPCAWSVGEPLPYAQMAPFTADNGTQHQTVVSGLNPDPNVVNDVYVRCLAQTNYLLHLQYRAISEANPPYPRKGNLWGWYEWLPSGLPYMSRVDLWLGATPDSNQVATLRQLNPHVRILTSINAVENGGLPDDYYLHDVNGKKIEVWPGSYRLNLTQSYVARYQANYAYQTVLNTGLLTDGVFFDNVFTTQSWLTQDIYGHPVQISANNDGVATPAATLDAEWKAGVFLEIQTFRQLMPNALTCGHAMDIYERGIAALFNGISIGFDTDNVLEGRMGFSTLYGLYHDWNTLAVPPPITMVESSPMSQISYGYGYSPLSAIPPSTLEFARTYYPYVRFGLALTLMSDGFFAHEFGDTYHGNNWWYDELDYNLGYPLGPAQAISLSGPAVTNLIVNGGFEQPLSGTWGSWANTGCAVSISQQTANAAVGNACARLDVSKTDGIDGDIELAQYNRTLIQKTNYQLTFWARASTNRYISVSSQKDSPNWDNYGLYQSIAITTNWQQYSVTFTATESATDARLQFFVGATTGTVWLDEVVLKPATPTVYRRDFNNGIVLLNPTAQAQDFNLGPGFHRLTGTQAPMYEWIMDDSDPAFSTIGSWTNVDYDSGYETVYGPYYHSWAGTSHLELTGGGLADWPLAIPADNNYTIYAWWPAAPSATNWTTQASYQILSGTNVLAATNYDQTSAGDQWHLLGTVQLLATNATSVRLTSASGICLADALHIYSASRLNNGQAAETVHLAPMDGIILQRDVAMYAPPAFGLVSPFADHLSLLVTNLTPGVSYTLQKSPTLAANSWQPVQVFQTRGFSTNLSDALPPAKTPVFYRLREN